MFTLSGKYGEAKVLQDKDLVERGCLDQIQKFMDNPVVENSNVAIMPDCHAGKGSCIGFTQTLSGRCDPDMVGVDIGCGIYAFKLEQRLLAADFEKLDKIIQESIPSGFARRKTQHPYADEVDLGGLIATVAGDEKFSIGTLGGGNHFIEIDRDGNGDHWLVIHSGSRHLGVEVCSFWKKRGNEFGFVEGSDFDGYLHDMKIAQKFAHLNRMAMMETITRQMQLSVADEIFSIHNYIDTDAMILRKGATSLNLREKAVIPINMAYGSLIVEGTGNEAFNCSGPHGAGRSMSRTEARKTLSMDDYEESMRGIFSSSVSKATIDESPMAYKPVDSILENIRDLCVPVQTIKPVYNFKAK